MTEYFPIVFGDDAKKIILDSLCWLKTVRFRNQSDKDNRIMRTQCTNAINCIRSGSNQYTLNKLETILTALGLAHRTFRCDAAAYQAFAEEFCISAARSAYIRTLASLYRDIQSYLDSQGYHSDISLL